MVSRNLNQYDRNVIPASIITRSVHQLLGCNRQIQPQFADDVGYLVIFNHVVQPVRAHQIDITGLDRILVELRLDLRLDAKRSRYQILVINVARIFRLDQPQIDLLLQQRMVFGQASKFQTT